MKMFGFCLTVFIVDIHISLKLVQNFGSLNKHGWAGVASWMCICFEGNCIKVTVYVGIVSSLLLSVHTTCYKRCQANVAVTALV